MSIIYHSESRICDYCLKRGITEWYSCLECPRDVCYQCLEPYTREAHTHLNGPGHAFALNRVRRTCRSCRVPITRNFLKCTECSTDVCMKCSIDTSYATGHRTRFGASHRFIHVKLQPVHPLNELEIISVRNRPTYDDWKCRICKGVLQLGALVCLDCQDFDLCTQCVDKKEGARHARRTHHSMVFYILNVDGLLSTSSAAHFATSMDNLGASTSQLPLHESDIHDHEEPPPYAG